MKPETKALMERMVRFAQEGNDIYPAFWQPLRGRSNLVSAAIRIAKTQNLIEEAGKDGCGKPYYRAVLPKATHAAPSIIQ